MLTCPVCRSRDIRRSARRNLIERLWSMGGRYPYRCYACQTRFFAFRVPHPHSGKSDGEEPVEGHKPVPDHDSEED